MSDEPSSELEEIGKTRASLLARLKNESDEQSWRDFYNMYGRLIFGYSLHFNISHAEAEDIVQEVCVKVFRQIGRFDYSPERGRFRGWLKTITRNTVIDYLRRRNSRKNVTQELQASREWLLLGGEAKIEEELWELEWKRALYENALERVRDRVDDGTFHVFRLYVLDGAGLEAVSSESGMTANAIYAVKHRILRYIREEIDVLKGLEEENAQT